MAIAMGERKDRNGEPDEGMGSEDFGLWDFDEEFLAAMEAEEEAAVEILRGALPELHGVEPPSAELAAAASNIRAGLDGDEWPYGYMMGAAGWDEPPADDVELWLGAVGGFVSIRADTGMEIEEEAAIMALELADWLVAVIGLARAGVGASASPEALVSYINACPEVEGEIDFEDAVVVETAFELALPAWEAAGALDDRRRLTALGKWGLPRALAWAWNHDFDPGRASDPD
ncbi:MAG: hypothetical protein ACRDSJ_04185 [Rubrobacteraceae bacterium]